MYIVHIYITKQNITNIDYSMYIHWAYLYSMHFGSKSSYKHKDILMIRLTDWVRLPASLLYNKCNEYILNGLDYVVHK